MSQPTNQELYTLLIHLEKKIDLLNARLNIFQTEVHLLKYHNIYS